MKNVILPFLPLLPGMPGKPSLPAAPFTPGKPVAKGAEKGYFAFGGSSTLTLFEPGAVRLETDLLENSRRQIELYARIGSQMGRSA